MKKKIKHRDRNTALKAFLIPVLRRASYRWSPRSEAIKAAKVGIGKYKCALCESIVGAKEFTVDHKTHVVPIETGFDNWDGFVNRMFCEADEFQIICKSCDATKTLAERELRKVFRQARKGLEDEPTNTDG